MCRDDVQAVIELLRQSRALADESQRLRREAGYLLAGMPADELKTVALRTGMERSTLEVMARIAYEPTRPTTRYAMNSSDG